MPIVFIRSVWYVNLGQCVREHKTQSVSPLANTAFICAPHVLL